MSTSTIIALVAAFVVFDIVVVALVMRAIWRRRGQINPHWQWLADRFGLKVVGGEPRFPNSALLRFIPTPVHLEGEYQGHALKIYHYTVRGGNNSSVYATARISGPNPRELSFRFHREGLFSKIGKSLGMQDVQTGDPRFDELMILKCNDEMFIKVALLPEIRQRFFDVWEKQRATGTIRLEGDTLSYDERGRIQSEEARERFAAVVDLLCALRGAVISYSR